MLIQKSTREGFGLTVTEAMWKAKAVIGGNVGGIRIQIEDGVSGYLVDSPEECARRLVQLLRDPQLRSRLGEGARESVRERFLMPRLAFDYLEVAKAHATGAVEAAGVKGSGVKGAGTLDAEISDVAAVPGFVTEKASKPTAPAEKVRVRVPRKRPT